MTEVVDQGAALTLRSVSKAYTRDLRLGRRNGLRAIGAEFRPNARVDRDDLRSGEFWAVQDVSLALAPGEALGIIGFNGGGKSTLLRLIAGITQPTSGEIVRVGTVASLLDTNAGFNPILTGRENATVAYTVLRGAPPTPELLDEMMEYAGLKAAADHPLRTYSQGMRVRLGFSVMVFVDADVLVIDEALAVGDAGFQMQCLEHLHSHCRAGGSLVFVSHSMWVFQNMASRGLCLDDGHVVFDGSSEDVADHYLTMIRERSISGSGDGPDLLQREQVIRRSAAEGSPEGDDASSNGPGLVDYGEADVNQRPVQFIRVEITDGEGGPPAVGRPISLAIELRSSEDFASATVGFMVWTADLTISVFADLSHDVVGSDVVGFPLGSGRSTLRCRVDPNPLLAGQYAVRAAIYDGPTGDILGMTGFEDTPWWFDLPGVAALPGEVVLRGAMRPLRVLDGHLEG